MRPLVARSASQRISSVGDLSRTPLLVTSAPKERWRVGRVLAALLLPALKVNTCAGGCAGAGGVACAAASAAAVAQNSAGERCGGAAASVCALGLLA